MVTRQKYSILFNPGVGGLLTVTLLTGFLPFLSRAQGAQTLPQTPAPAVVLYPKAGAVQLGKYDTIMTGAILYEGDTIPYRELADVYIFAGTPQQYARMMEKWTRLRNAVYVTYPYAVAAGRVINDINAHLAFISDEKERKAYIKSREKDLRGQFTNQLEQMSVYQGRVLMKLINRQTGNNCYEIIKEYKGGFNARLYQTVAFFFGSSLKQPYDAAGEDRPIESVVQEINRMYSRR
jgi:hypothetical protein